MTEPARSPLRWRKGRAAEGDDIEKGIDAIPERAYKGGTPMKTYFVKDVRGEFELTVDDDDEITFGPVVPFPARLMGGPMTRPPRGAEMWPPNQQVYAIRVYAAGGKKRLRGVWTGVYEVREAGIRVDRLAGGVEDFPKPRAAEEDDTLGGRLPEIKGEGEQLSLWGDLREVSEEKF